MQDKRPGQSFVKSGSQNLLVLLVPRMGPACGTLPCWPIIAQPTSVTFLELFSKVPSLFIGKVSGMTVWCWVPLLACPAVAHRVNLTYQGINPSLFSRTAIFPESGKRNMTARPESVASMRIEKLLMTTGAQAGEYTFGGMPAASSSHWCTALKSRWGVCPDPGFLEAWMVMKRSGSGIS